jgi:hypothetical protein
MSSTEGAVLMRWLTNDFPSNSLPMRPLVGSMDIRAE